MPASSVRSASPSTAAGSDGGGVEPPQAREHLARFGRAPVPEILADAAWFILTSDAKTTSGNFFIDDTVLADHGVTDLERYSVTPGTKEFVLDFFVD